MVLYSRILEVTDAVEEMLSASRMESPSVLPGSFLARSWRSACLFNFEINLNKPVQFRPSALEEECPHPEGLVGL